MVLKVSTRGEVPPFIVMDVMREANAMEAAGEHVLHMEVGQPGTGARRGWWMPCAARLEYRP